MSFNQHLARARLNVAHKNESHTQTNNLRDMTKFNCILCWLWFSVVHSTWRLVGRCKILYLHDQYGIFASATCCDAHISIVICSRVEHYCSSRCARARLLISGRTITSRLKMASGGLAVSPEFFFVSNYLKPREIVSSCIVVVFSLVLLYLLLQLVEQQWHASWSCVLRRSLRTRLICAFCEIRYYKTTTREEDAMMVRWRVVESFMCALQDDM